MPQLLIAAFNLKKRMTDANFEIGPDDIMSGPMVPPSILEGLHLVASLDLEVVKKISQVIGDLDGLSNRQLVEESIAKVLPDEQQNTTVEIYKIITALNEEEIPKVVRIVKSWAARKESRKELFPESLISKLEPNLRELIGGATIDLIKKADRLIRDTSNELDSFKFICDLRPVFDDSREEIDALVLLANLRIRYLGQNGEKGAFEIALTEDELTQLKEEVESAIGKMNVMKKLSTNLNNAKI